MINERIVKQFVEHIENYLQYIIKACYSYNKHIILWTDPYIYEDAETNKIASNIDPQKEYIVFSVKNIFKHDLFQTYLKSHTSLNLKTKNNMLYICSAICNKNNEMDNLSRLLDFIEVIHHNKGMSSHRKTTLKIDGKLLLRPDREYWINFINESEYVVHVYDIHQKKKNMLFYLFRPLQSF